LLVAIARFRIGERLRPALPLAPAGAARVVGFLEFASVGQIRISLARRRRGLLDCPAKRKRVQCHVGVGAQGPADVLQAVRPAPGAGIGNGKETAVAGAHAYRIGARMGVGAPVLARLARLFVPAILESGVQLLVLLSRSPEPRYAAEQSLEDIGGP